MERCLRSKDFDVGIESREASKSAVNLSQVEIILDLQLKDYYIEDHFQVLGQSTKKQTLSQHILHISISAATWLRGQGEHHGRHCLEGWERIPRDRRDATIP